MPATAVLLSAARSEERSFFGRCLLERRDAESSRAAVMGSFVDLLVFPAHLTSEFTQDEKVCETFVERGSMNHRQMCLLMKLPRDFGSSVMVLIKSSHHVSAKYLLCHACFFNTKACYNLLFSRHEPSKREGTGGIPCFRRPGKFSFLSRLNIL